MEKQTQLTLEKMQIWTVWVHLYMDLFQYRTLQYYRVCSWWRNQGCGRPTINYAQINPHIVQKSTVFPNGIPTWGLNCFVVLGMSFPSLDLTFSMDQVRKLDLVIRVCLPLLSSRGIPSPLIWIFLTTIDLLLLLFFKYLETLKKMRYT